MATISFLAVVLALARLNPLLATDGILTLSIIKYVKANPSSLLETQFKACAFLEVSQ